MPQTETVGVPATPTLKKIVTTLPEGFTVDPSAGDGLQACSEAQIGWLHESDLSFNAAPPQCPEASKIGSLELETPLIPHKLEGAMYLANQNENPFGTTLAAYVVVDDPITGVLIKIAGKFIANMETGRLTAEFDENPNLPFSDLKLHFFGGPRAELATPESCGTFTTTSELVPYSFPDSGLAASPFDNFTIDEVCPGGFSPELHGWNGEPASRRLHALRSLFLTVGHRPGTCGAYGHVAAWPIGGRSRACRFARKLRSKPPRTGTGGCLEASRVGSVEAGAGPGPDPLFVSGKAYLTGPYNGGPYGLAIVVPAIAGPFDFGTVVVRQSIRIDPRTARSPTCLIGSRRSSTASRCDCVGST